MPMGSGYPMQGAGMMHGGMMNPMTNGMMPQYGAPMPNMMQPQQMQPQPSMYPYQNGMMNWPCQTGGQLGQVHQMQNPTPSTPVFQFQISPGKSTSGRK